MNTAETQLKGLMLRDKQFLKELYEGSSAELKKKTLTFASDVKLNTLIKFLHFLTNGHICMKKDNFEQIPTKNLKYLRKCVEKKAAFSRLLKAERSEKLKVLKSQASIYQLLLYCLFNEE